MISSSILYSVYNNFYESIVSVSSLESIAIGKS